MKKSQLRHIIREIIKEQVKKTATMQPKKFEKKPMYYQNPPATRGFTNPLPPKGGGGVKLDLPKGPGHTPGPGDACYNAVGMVYNTPGGNPDCSPYTMLWGEPLIYNNMGEPLTVELSVDGFPLVTSGPIPPSTVAYITNPAFPTAYVYGRPLEYPDISTITGCYTQAQWTYLEDFQNWHQEYYQLA